LAPELRVEFAPETLPAHGDLEAFFEFHRNPRTRDFGSGKARDETVRPLGVECGVITDTAPVAQWIARPPPKGQVAGSIPARGTNSRFEIVQESLKPSVFPTKTGTSRVRHRPRKSCSIRPF